MNIYLQQQEDKQKTEKQGAFNCCYLKLGCLKIDKDREKMTQHEMSCNFQNTSCFNSCSWLGKLRELPAHLRTVSINNARNEGFIYIHEN